MKKKEKTPKNTGAKEEKPNKYIYIGDNYLTTEISIVKNTIFDDLTPFAKVFEDDNELKKLFVEINEFSKIKHRLKEPNHSLNKIIKSRRGK